VPAAPSSLRQLPSGRHRLSPQAVESDQRRRLLAALARALEEHGYAHTTVAQVIEGSGVSRRTFYEQFDDKDDCFLAAYEDAERRAWVVAAAAVARVSPDDWPGRVRAALGAILDFIAAEPARARLFTLEARAVGQPIADRHRRAVDRAATMLRAGNHAAGLSAPDLAEGTERTLVGNVAALAGAYVLSGATELLPSLCPQLADHLLSSYGDPKNADASQV
jgi:AcrR family transcriptional regulator